MCGVIIPPSKHLLNDISVFSIILIFRLNTILIESKISFFEIHSEDKIVSTSKLSQPSITLYKL